MEFLGGFASAIRCPLSAFLNPSRTFGSACAAALSTVQLLRACYESDSGDGDAATWVAVDMPLSDT